MHKPRIWQQCHTLTNTRCIRSLSRPRQFFNSCHRTYATEPHLAADTPSAEPFLEAPAESLTFQEFVPPPPIVFADAANMKTYKPRTPGLRHLKRPINDHLYKGRAYLPLTFPRKGHHIGGRNFSGRLVVRHRGGGHKRRIRIVDFTRMEAGKKIVERVEHDPGRSAHIALVSDVETGEKSYILAPEGMRANEVVQSYRQGIPEELLRQLSDVNDQAMIAAKTAWRGNCLPLHMIPPGALIFNIGLTATGRGQLCRTAGSYGTIVVDTGDTDPKYAKYVNVKLQSGEVRRIHRDACATIGVASNGNHGRRQLGKAGRSRWLGIRPTVRGVAMNAADHPHGGGRGKSKGNRIPVSIWGRTLVSILPFSCRDHANCIIGQRWIQD